MQKKNAPFAEKCKESSRKVFTKIGHSAVGNPLGEDSRRENTPIAPFSFPHLWSFEKPMPKRKSK